MNGTDLHKNEKKHIAYVFENFSGMNAEVSLCNCSTWVQLQTASILDQFYASRANLLHRRLDPTSHLTQTGCANGKQSSRKTSVYQ